MLSFETKIFLAAKSLWTKPFPERYCIPKATCWENLSNISGRSGLGSCPGLWWSREIRERERERERGREREREKHFLRGVLGWFVNIMKHYQNIVTCIIILLHIEFSLCLSTHSGLIECRKSLKSPPCIISTTSIICIQCNVHMLTYCFIVCNCILTGSLSLITPCSVTMLGCLNCAIMAASWRNLTLSTSLDPSLRVFNATSKSSFFFHSPLSTLPNWPDPRWPVILVQN